MIWWKMLFRAGTPAHWKSIKEIIIVLLVSMSPLYLGALLHWYLDEKSASYLTSFRTVIERGELFLYSMAVVSSIVWLANKDWFLELWSRPSFEPVRDSQGVEDSDNPHLERPSRRLSPPKWIFNLFSILAYGTCSMFFGVEAANVEIASSKLISLSSVIYVISIILWHVINVLSSVDPPNVERNLDAGARELAARLRTLRAQNGN